MQLVRRFRVPALFCALAVLVCELVAHPFAEMGVSDDGPYVLMAQHLANTGHIAYNGSSSAMLGWQLYLGAAFIKFFGFSFTTVRMSTLLVAVLMAFVLQRTLVRTGINERNATLGTLAFVLSPLYLMLSVTYMTDIAGLFAVVICLYACLRALQASTDRATIAWLCFAVATNALLGTARQIAWFGILVMVPSTLWLMRAKRLNPSGPKTSAGGPDRVFVAGAAATLVGARFIFACMQWLARQPYTIPEHLTLHGGGEFHALSTFFRIFLEMPFLLLPVVILFLPELRRSFRRSIQVASVAALVYILGVLAIHSTHPETRVLLEPVMRDWVSKYGGYGSTYIRGSRPIFLPTGMRVVLTVASLGGLLGLIASLLHSRKMPSETDKGPSLPWRQRGILLAPFAIAYSLILIPRATAGTVFDRYLLELLAVALPCMILYYQEQIQPRLPSASLLLIAITAIYSIVDVHNMFAFYRARVALTAELRADGVPDTSTDGGWEENNVVELQHANHINERRIEMPADAYVPTPPPPAGACSMYFYEDFPHIRPLYGVSFDPNACYEPAPFAPVYYSRWPYRTPGVLYVVRYLPPSKE